MAKIFISYADEDKKISTKLELKLKHDGAETWIDFAKIYEVDNFVEAMDKGLDWCDILILLWSKSAKASHWVKKEWTAAFASKKRIAICRLDDEEPPTILSNLQYADLTNFSNGYKKLSKILNIQ